MKLMKTQRHSSSTQPLMASSLLAVAYVVPTNRDRAREWSAHRYSSTNLPIHSTVSEHLPPTADHLHWYRRVTRRVDERIAALFHCALPNGLEPRDFDLSDLSELN